MNLARHCAIVELRDVLPPQRQQSLASQLWEQGVAMMRETQPCARCSLCGEDALAATCAMVAGRRVCARCREENNLP